MKANLFRIPVPAAGALSTMPRPRGDDWLDDEMAALREAGVDVLVTLQPEAERQEIGLAGEADAAARAGLEFHSFPIVDFGVPDHRGIQPLLATLTAAIRDGRHVAVHCLGGIGRSSLVAAAVLVRLGTPPADAWQSIADARGLPVPETDEQRHWLTVEAYGA